MKNRLNILRWGYCSWYPRNWFSNVRQFGRNLRYAWQRVTRGYADTDIWWLGDYVQELLSQSITQLAQTCHGHPVNEKWKTQEEWESYLLEMAEHFRKGIFIDSDINFPDPIYEELEKISVHESKELDNGMTQWTTTYIDPEKGEELSKKWIEFLHEQAAAVSSETQKGLEMLQESIQHLWD